MAVFNNISKIICRFCLQSGVEYISLCSKSEESTDIRNKIYDCFQITIPFEKFQPDAICFDCVKEVNSANNFRLKCISIEEGFRDYSDQNNVTPPENEADIDSSVFDHTVDTTVYHDMTIIDKSGDNIEKKDLNNYYNDGFKCTVCKKVLKTKASLVKHSVSMHEKRKHVGKVSGCGPERRYHCTTCSYSTPHSQTLVNHMRRHNGERPYICECGKSFTQSSSLVAHRKTHSNTTYYTCSLCGKQFKHAFTMKNHLRVHESASFSCSICYKTLKSKQSLQAHLRRHYNICNYNCEACGDTFVTSAELLNHRKKHNLEKKVECHLCGYKTHTKKNLIIHLKRHTGNREFKCNMCQVAFYTQSNLRRHQRVHTRDKPFSCQTCSQKFSYSPSLNKHMKTVHGVDYKWADFKWKDTKVLKLYKD